MRSIIIASTSTIFGEKPLDYLLEELKIHFQNANTILFIPYARPGGISHKEYTQKIKEPFEKIGKKIKGINEYKNPTEAIKQAEGIYVGGGNTFVLVSQLYKNDCLNPLKKQLRMVLHT